MNHFARGSFVVDVQPLASPPAEGLSRFSIVKKIHGDIEGTSRGEMLAGGDYKLGAAGYVAMEFIIGVLHGRQGGFALQQIATMDAGGSKISVTVVPGSGTGELKGIAGTFKIQIADGQHSYEFEYTLPP